MYRQGGYSLPQEAVRLLHLQPYIGNTPNMSSSRKNNRVGYKQGDSDLDGSDLDDENVIEQESETDDDSNSKSNNDDGDESNTNSEDGSSSGESYKEPLPGIADTITRSKTATDVVHFDNSRNNCNNARYAHHNGQHVHGHAQGYHQHHQQRHRHHHHHPQQEQQPQQRQQPHHQAAHSESNVMINDFSQISSTRNTVNTTNNNVNYPRNYDFNNNLIHDVNSYHTNAMTSNKGYHQRSYAQANYPFQNLIGNHHNNNNNNNNPNWLLSDPNDTSGMDSSNRHSKQRTTSPRSKTNRQINETHEYKYNNNINATQNRHSKHDKRGNRHEINHDKNDKHDKHNKAKKKKHKNHNSHKSQNDIPIRNWEVCIYIV